MPYSSIIASEYIITNGKNNYLHSQNSLLGFGYICQENFWDNKILIFRLALTEACVCGV